MITGLVVALPEEISSLKPLPRYVGADFTKGHCSFLSDGLLVVHSGAGHENAQNAAKLLVQQGATALISWGCAAGLDASLKPGDLTLANTLVDAEGTVLELDNHWHTQVLKLLSITIKIHTGALADSKILVATSHDKQRLASQTHAIALDMESLAIAQVAQDNGIPFLAIRAIADPVSMDLPKAVSHALNPQGEVVLSKLLTFLALHPTELPNLVKLGLHFHAAKKTLTNAAKKLDQLAQLYANSNGH